ncbi:TFIIH complex serine/threonine-protein kinase subunit kin28 [Rhizophlyctis rosea]|uniref:[RNA-polymerase]-subunit kinase n=1 Tax=Rhizophlyctis rosea TaxID=64517 RepID=A0AAD5SCW5_9FUNG|nr:TFIIH complex serine/threonine-protein kinase subunit kin28 [Rhizophlyctis rosea]
MPDILDIFGPPAGAVEYIKEKKIGEGTYAVVYQGWAVPIVKISPEDKSKEVLPDKDKEAVAGKRKIAIKKIKVNRSAWKDGMDLASIREVKFLRELKHPNIIELIDVFSHKTNLNLVLEFLDADLEMLIKNKPLKFSAADIKSWMLMLCRGIYHCHRHFILHRDLKPNNLLLASDGQLKIADFGLARDYGDPKRPMTSEVVTRWYRSPELLMGAKMYSGAVDMWSVGCIFAELLMRVPYFAGDTDIGQLDMIFQALGTPTEADWPGMKHLPSFVEFKRYQRTPYSQLFTAAGPDALDLLDKLLQFDPLKRLSAADTLDHFYFRNSPRPTPPEKLPRTKSTEHHKQAVDLPSDLKIAGMPPPAAGGGITLGKRPRPDDTTGETRPPKLRQ